MNLQEAISKIKASEVYLNFDSDVTIECCMTEPDDLKTLFISVVAPARDTSNRNTTTAYYHGSGLIYAQMSNEEKQKSGLLMENLVAKHQLICKEVITRHPDRVGYRLKNN